MATQSRSNEQQMQQSQGESTRSSQQSGALSRRGGYSPWLTPHDFFRMSPFSLMRRMSEEFDRFFTEGKSGDSGERLWAPAIEVSQRGNHYVVSAELPGIKPEDVKLEVSDDSIVLQGERKTEHEETRHGVHVSERHYGNFYRAIPLPEGAKAENIQAKFDNGILEITVPTEQQQAKRRQIQIQGSTAGKPSSSSGRAA